MIEATLIYDSSTYQYFKTIPVDRKDLVNEGKKGK